MEVSRRIAVPFEKKAKARKLGAFFDKTDRCWYVPEGASEETEAALRSLATEENDDCSMNENYKDAEIQGADVLQNETIPEQESVPFLSDIPESRWTELIETKDTLKIATFIRDAGMPNNEKQREEILKILALRRPGDYPVTYDGMMECSEQFASLYSKERATQLIRSCIKGERPYMEEIKNSGITEEEKALLMFVLPL